MPKVLRFVEQVDVVVDDDCAPIVFNPVGSGCRLIVHYNITSLVTKLVTNPTASNLVTS